MSHHLLVLIFTIFSLPAYAQVFSCVVENARLKSTIRLEKNGEGNLKVVDSASKTEANCELSVIAANDNLKGVVQDVSITAVRSLDCTPSLSQELQEGIDDEIEIRIIPDQAGLIRAQTFLYELSEIAACRVTYGKLKEIVDLIPKWNSRRSPNSTKTKKIKKLKLNK